ncbi:unnamed protein product, partial [Musa hybrid cultivar]
MSSLSSKWIKEFQESLHYVHGKRLRGRRGESRLVRAFQEEVTKRPLRVDSVSPRNERVAQELRHRPPLPALFLQAALDEAPELARRRTLGDGACGLAEADRHHQRRPVGARPLREQREVAAVQLQNRQPQAPHVGRVRIVVTAVGHRVEPLRAHVSARAHVGVAGVERPPQHLAHPEVGDLDLPGGVDEEVGRLDVAVDDLAGMKLGQTEEGLAGDSRESGLGEGAATAAEQHVEGPAVHVLEEECDVAGRGGDDGVEADDVVGVDRPAEDVDLAVHLAAKRDVSSVGVHHLERVQGGGAAVADLIDGSPVAVAENPDLLEVREPELGRRRGGGGGRGRGGGEGRRHGAWRQQGREREAEAAVGGGAGVGELESEVEVREPSVADDGHADWGKSGLD